jgi:anti-sigma B factor antagonist
VDDDRFSIRTERPADLDGVVVVEVAGEVDLRTAPELEGELLGLTSDATRIIVLDLTGCSFIDSSALNAIVHAKTAADAAQCRFALVCPSENLMRVMRIAGLDRVLEIHRSREAVGA